MPDWMHTLWFGMSMLCLLGAVLSWIFRAAKIPGGSPAASIVAGCLAGVLLGTSVLGAVSPETYERWFLGGFDEVTSLRTLEREHLQERIAMQAADVTEAAIKEHVIRQQSEFVPLQTAHDEALQHHADLLFKIALVMLLLWSAASVVSTSPSRFTTTLIFQPSASGVLAVVVAGTSTLFAVQYLTPFQWEASIASGLCAAVGTLTLDARAARRASIRRADLHIASTAALLTTVTAMFVVGNQLGDSRLGIMIPAALLAGMFIFPLPTSPRSIKRLARALLWACLVPTIAALAFIHVDVLATVQLPSFWIALLIITILCHDGRWLGSWLSIRLVGTTQQKHLQWQLSGGMLDTGVGAAQAALAGVLVIAGILPPSLGPAVVLAALFLELAQPIRQPVATWMDEKLHPPHREDRV